MTLIAPQPRLDDLYITPRLDERPPRREDPMGEKRALQELAARIELCGAYEQVWWYGSFTLPPHPLDNSDEADRMMVVLRK